MPSTMAAMLTRSEGPSHQVRAAERQHPSRERIEQARRAKPREAVGRGQRVGGKLEEYRPVRLLAQSRIVALPLGTARGEEARVPLVGGEEGEHHQPQESSDEDGRAQGQPEMLCPGEARLDGLPPVEADLAEDVQRAEGRTVVPVGARVLQIAPAPASMAVDRGRHAHGRKDRPA